MTEIDGIILAGSSFTPDDGIQSIDAQETSSMRHVMPKSKVSHAILHENTSQERHLNMTLSKLRARQEKFANSYQLNRKNFIDTQSRKHRKWKREDEVRTLNMNLKNVRAGFIRRESMEILYESPVYNYEDEEAVKEIQAGALLPYMKIRREKTEVIKHKNDTFMTKLPTLIEIDKRKYKMYNTYCGTTLLKPGGTMNDPRFLMLAETLGRDPKKMKMLDSDEEDEDFQEDEKLGNDKDVQVPMSDSEVMGRGDGSLVVSQHMESVSPSYTDEARDKMPDGPERSRVIFPSINRRGYTAPVPEPHSDFEAGAKQRSFLSETNISYKRKSKSNKIMKDLKTKDLRALVHRYGKLKAPYTNENEQNGRSTDASLEANEDKTYRSQTLKMVFTVDTHKK